MADYSKIEQASVRSSAMAVVWLLTLLLVALPAAGQDYDVVILKGRVMDPETMMDAVRNVGVKDGKIAAITNKRYYFEFADMPNVVWVDMDKLNLGEGASIQKFNLATHSDASGQVADMFNPTEPSTFIEAGAKVN